MEWTQSSQNWFKEEEKKQSEAAAIIASHFFRKPFYLKTLTDKEKPSRSVSLNVYLVQLKKQMNMESD